MAVETSHAATIRKYCQDLKDVTRLLSQSLDKDVIILMALEHVHNRLGKRARYSVLENGKLCIKYWVGDYDDEFQTHQEIVPRSVVWKVFQDGHAVNLTDPSQSEGFNHTLSEPVKIKAIVPLRYVHARRQEEVKFGVLVVDSGTDQTPIAEEEFEYLLVMSDLIGETVGKAELVQELVQSYEHREQLVQAMAHYLRNRFMTIGGFARRLQKNTPGGKAREYADIILREIGEMELRLSALEETWEREEVRIGRRKTEGSAKTNGS
jgi:signal transduction histidine kinase